MTSLRQKAQALVDAFGLASQTMARDPNATTSREFASARDALLDFISEALAAPEEPVAVVLRMNEDGAMLDEDGCEWVLEDDAPIPSRARHSDPTQEGCVSNGNR